MTLTYKDIAYTLKRSKRKTASIYVERDGQITVIVPDDLSSRQISDLLESRRKWIYKNLADWHDLNATKVEREYVNGEGFLYLGRSYRLKLVKDQEEPLLLKDGYFCLRTDQKASAAAAFRTFYRAKGLVRIGDRAAYYESKMGVTAKSVRVLDLKNRWASCSADGHLNFHWKCMMAPTTILDYIVVHELAHLHYPNHTAAFWNEVDKVMPDCRERKDWLRVNGAGMDV